jgi:hypothetical protein
VSPHTVVADRGGPTEVVLTPVGAFSASPYSGSLTEPVAAACRRRAMQIRAELEARPAGLVGRSDDGTRVMVPVAEGANT